MEKDRVQGRWPLNGFGMAMGRSGAWFGPGFWLYAQVIIWVFPKIQSLPHTFPVSCPSVSHCTIFFTFFFCILTHFSLNKCILKGNLITRFCKWRLSITYHK